MNYVLYSDGRFEVSKDGTVTTSDCKMINHYKFASEQLRQSHEWKNGTEHVFGDSFMIERNSYFEPRVNGITSVDGDFFYYGLELEKGGGIYKKSK